MRLTELDPRWFAVEGLRCGLTFECPHCRIQRLGVVFHHHARAAIEDQAILARRGASDVNHIWDLQGQEDFQTLTLSPSIDASASGHWHGFITKGAIA
jgi:hypothetical protein